MDYLNRANNVRTNANTMYHNTNNMMNNIRQPPNGLSHASPRQPMQNQLHPFNHGIKETFFDSTTSSEWWIILLLLIGMFIMLYWLKKGKEGVDNLMLL
jgi:hypothetical protein